MQAAIVCLRSIGWQQRMTVQLLTGPRRHSGATIDAVDCNDRVRFGKRYGARKACLLQGFEERIVDESLGILRVQMTPQSAAMHTHVKRTTSKSRQPFDSNRVGLVADADVKSK